MNFSLGRKIFLMSTGRLLISRIKQFVFTATPKSMYITKWISMELCTEVCMDKGCKH